MLSKHLIFCVCVHFIVLLRCCCCELESEENSAISKNVAQIRNTLLEVTPLLNSTVNSAAQNCVQIICKFVCFNGHARDIARDIDTVAAQNNHTCTLIEELRLYNYVFPDGQISYGFLGSYSDKVEILYVASSNVTEVSEGSFAGGIFKEIVLENLQLTQLKKDFFKGITLPFQSLSIIQKEYPLQWVGCDFLDYVKYQIQYLTMQVGIPCVRNLTGSQNLLNNLIYADFSYNNFHELLTNSVFCKLSMVEHLDLSHSNIEYLPPYIFADLATTLDYLNLSFNKLKTLSRTLFGWREIPRDLRIYADENNWECTCEFQMEMKQIIMFQTTKLVCSEPEIYHNWSIFDDDICQPNYVQPFDRETPTTSSNYIEAITTESAIWQSGDHIHLASKNPMHAGQLRPDEVSATVSSTTDEPATVIKSDFVQFSCHSGLQNEDPLHHDLKWPSIEFSILSQDQLRVAVAFKPSAMATTPVFLATSASENDSYGLIWFSKVTTEYYKMEINYNDYGLGCYKSISPLTTVKDLIPNVAYTFCMVLHNQMTISPFSCKSIHIGGNLNIQYSSAWLSTDMKTTGLSLVIFGIVMFSFAGILLIYMLLKHKPILLRGSKRVTIPGGSRNSADIVVMPRAKSVKSIKEKEVKLAQKSPPFCAERRRRNSSESVDSYESYINANLYEVIPAYMKFENPTNSTASTSTTSSTASIMPKEQRISCVDLENDFSYIMPPNNMLTSADLENYAEIPYRTKRVSNDPLPELPDDQEPLNCTSLEEKLERKYYPDMGVIYMLDSQV